MVPYKNVLFPVSYTHLDVYKRQTLGGDLETPYEFGCRLQKKRIECAIMIQAELEQAGIDGSIPVALG